MTQTFEFDDYPRDYRRLMAWLDVFKRRYPQFKCNVFAIPTEMHENAWREVNKRRDWISIGVHGFEHKKRECRDPEVYSQHMRLLDQLAKSKDYDRVFKAPWYGYDGQFVQELAARDFVICAKSLTNWPFPNSIDHKLWSLTDHETRMQHRLGPDGPWDALHAEAHPVYRSYRARIKSSSTEMSGRNVRRWRSGWYRWSTWDWVQNLARPALLKLNLGCGQMVLDGWHNLDPRTELDPRIIKWTWEEQLPWGENKADLILTSHVFNYVDEMKYEEALLECWRVLRPGGIVRMQEDRTDQGYIWKYPGARRTRGTGVIRSLPTREKVIAALQRVGFEIHDSQPGKTLSPHKDVLNADTRTKRWRDGHKFYVEGVKVVPEDYDVSRPRRRDTRAMKMGRYRLPTWEDVN